jgi:predicted ATPase
MAENETQRHPGISKITVSGFKSLYDETSIEIRPLTILAGANSSGKSSIMQPLLLMKQTLEAQYDPGTFLLNGAHVKFFSAQDFFAKDSEAQLTSFGVEIHLDSGETLHSEYIRVDETSVEINKTTYQKAGHKISLKKDMSPNEMAAQMPADLEKLRKTIDDISLYDVEWAALRNRCFLDLGFHYSNGETSLVLGGATLNDFPVNHFAWAIGEIIHLPGLRGNPEHFYPATPVQGPRFEGTFDKYTAAITAMWTNSKKENEKSEALTHMMGNLGLASGFGVMIAISNDNQPAYIGLVIGRSKNPNANDIVNIADVGLGVSQVLPVLVALLVAEPGQLVYIEQPELHLHPRAQVALAEILAEAANRGVRVVIETHSSLLLQGVQTVIAQQKLPHEKVIFHWFTRDEDGKTHIDSHAPDEFGTTGDLPEDFSIVELETQNHYMTAVEKRELEQWHESQKSEVPGD